ncbi:hypothetical protein NLJ89_g4429 [Agrocybe chaxingu]|uniref:HNH nuclease domain-containing protein n=1 Tax=Agrocybe chaxingu TaxID=84603 RepID=A0A9W8K2P8_9AGAR|nr:hypothetical protein NLJ89_g4429 [Agrocybe chaxingu]
MHSNDCRSPIITAIYNGNGHLFCDREGKSPVPSSLLEAGEYFYVIDDNPSFNYSLFPSFDVWVPSPRSDVPDHWFSPQCPKKQGYKPAVSVRWTNIDATNRSAGICGPSKVPTLSPRKMLFGTAVLPYPNRLSGPHIVHDVRNFLTLRVDIHERWDKHTFFFIPFNGSLVLYFIGPLPDLYLIQYHFRKPNLPERVDPYLLFIRFTLAIFTLRLDTIIENPHPKQYKVALKGKGTTHRRCADPSAGGQLQTTMEEPDDVTMEGVEEVISGEGDHRDNVSELAELEELEDGPKLLVRIYEDKGWELPTDLAAAFIPQDEKIEAAKIAWFKANPQICQQSEDTPGVASEIPFE